MKVYLLRHTSLNVRENTFYGQTDLDVSENFKNELSEIKKKKSQNIKLKKMK